MSLKLSKTFHCIQSETYPFRCFVHVTAFIGLYCCRPHTCFGHRREYFYYHEKYTDSDAGTELSWWSAWPWLDLNTTLEPARVRYTRAPCNECTEWRVITFHISPGTLSDSSWPDQFRLNCVKPWWRHVFETFSASMVLCEGNPRPPEDSHFNELIMLRCCVFLSLAWKKLKNKHWVVVWCHAYLASPKSCMLVSLGEK